MHNLVEFMNYSLSEERSASAVFAEGDGAYSYEYFGARLAEKNGEKGAVFRVWAPNAQNVAVVGSFNDWNKTENFMNRNRDGVWELFIAGVGQGDTYKYCIETPWFEKIMKSDPFAFLIHAGSWKRKPDGSFYTYRMLADELTDYLCDMHFTHVQFMPLMEHPYDPSWGFQTTGYFAATSRYGTPEDLMYLIDTLHRHNIGVIMDWVPSNFPKDSFALSKFDGTALYESEDPKLGERPSWDTCLFNFARPRGNQLSRFVGGILVQDVPPRRTESRRAFVDAISRLRQEGRRVGA